ncbi:hybrid sensor histidine kinase/response regulator [Biformimicrobium ophioploci]|uniref:histidine kinase n=1 Tax=Biformimicrobium ophioploci TaxID=3036711 RepID=A0ABQ6M1Q5_9GAMM|nr:hybrid sensor histidine kinase/response regulator [Microbulbifer sp. NKW57]GMG88231.1 hypothetical protein MNKW57_25520 [Microbulbifer sp. NKW57]
MRVFDRPELKVQKDRRVCRATDSRIAKYSRRGLLISIVAFLLAIGIGGLRDVVPKLSLVLGLGLVLLTVLRGYYLFRFNSMYATGPHRWRSRYFTVSTLGALWWGLIVAAHAYFVGFSPETHFLWLYTVIFCSSVASVFAPYHRYPGIYITAAAGPAAVVGCLSGNLIGYIYGLSTLAFIWLLAHQGRRESENYWDRISAMQELKQRASTLAAAHRKSEAAVELTNEFISNVGQEFRSQLSDTLGALALLQDDSLTQRQEEWVKLARDASDTQLQLVDNVGLFTRVARKDIRLRHSQFNLVKKIQKTLNAAAEVAQQQGIEFNFLLDEDLPRAVVGDKQKTAHLLRNLTRSVITIAGQGEIWGQVRYNIGSDGEGLVELILEDDGKGEILPDESELFKAFTRVSTTQVNTGLGLSIAKGLAEAMGGYLQVNSGEDGNHYKIAIKYEVDHNQRAYFKPDPRLRGMRFSLIHQRGLYVNGMVQALTSLGADVETYSASREDGTLVLDSDPLVTPLLKGDVVLLAPALGDQAMLESALEKLSVIRLDFGEGGYLGIIGTPEHADQLEGFSQIPSLTAFFSKRPLNIVAFHDQVLEALFGESKKASRRVEREHESVMERIRRILLIEESHEHHEVTEEMLHSLGYQLQICENTESALAALSHKEYDLVLVDCQQNASNSAEIIEAVRQWQSVNDPTDHLPIVALTSTTDERFEGTCLAAGMDDYLTKPLTQADLKATLERWLGSVQ